MFDLFKRKKQAREVAEATKELKERVTHNLIVPNPFASAAKDMQVDVDPNTYDAPPRGKAFYRDAS